MGQVGLASYHLRVGLWVPVQLLCPQMFLKSQGLKSPSLGKGVRPYLLSVNRPVRPHQDRGDSKDCMEWTVTMTEGLEGGCHTHTHTHMHTHTRLFGG